MKVFISHATADAHFAHRLADDLQRLDLQVWIAPESIRPGEGWVSAIERGLEESSHMVVVLTPAALESQWVKKETDVAIARERKGRIGVIPLDVKPCEVPLLLSSYQMVSFRRDYNAGLSQLATNLGLCVAPPKPARTPRLWIWGCIVLVAALVIGGEIFLAFQGSGSTVTPVPAVQVTTPTATVTARATPMPLTAAVAWATTPVPTEAPIAAPIPPTDTPVPLTGTATNTPRPTATPTPMATATHTSRPPATPTSTATHTPRPPVTPIPTPTITPQPTGPIVLTIYLRDTLTETGFAALSGDQVNGGMIYQEGHFVYGEAAVQIGDTIYHFDKPEVGPGEPEQLPDPWRVEFEFDELLVARTGNQAGFDPKKAQFWAGTLDGNSAMGEDNPYSLTMKLYEGNEVRESIEVFFTVADAPGPGGGGPGDTPSKPEPN